VKRQRALDGRRTKMTSTDLMARLWILDLRRESFIEIGGTSHPADIWRRVRQRVDTNDITAQGDLVELSRPNASRVRRRAKELCERVLAGDVPTI
jgi:hypothetical protein